MGCCCSLTWQRGSVLRERCGRCMSPITPLQAHVKGQRQAHAQHGDSQRRGDELSVKPVERGGCRQRRHRSPQHKHRKQVGQGVGQSREAGPQAAAAAFAAAVCWCCRCRHCRRCGGDGPHVPRWLRAWPQGGLRKSSIAPHSRRPASSAKRLCLGRCCVRASSCRCRPAQGWVRGQARARGVWQGCGGGGGGGNGAAEVVGRQPGALPHVNELSPNA